MTADPSAAAEEGDSGRLPNIDDVRAAAARIAGLVVHTPILENPLLNRRLGFRLLVKAECLQPIGAFKLRGAMNVVAGLDPELRSRGVLAWSSGNHAQAVAAAAAAHGCPAVIVMPADAPRIKRRNTEAWGAEVVEYDRATGNREALGMAIAKDRGMTVVPPYDHPGTIAGQGTVGLEIAADLADDPPDAVYIPCGGGGLTAGCALALHDWRPELEIHAVEPAAFDDTALSMAAGEPVGHPDAGPSFCDALLSPQPGVLTFALNRRLLAGVSLVTDEAVAQAMATAFDSWKLVAEPGGAVAVAAAIAARRDSGDTVVAVISGGNVDPTLFAEVLTANDPW